MTNFKAIIEASTIGKGGAFVRVPIDIKEVYWKGRLKVNAAFDGIPYTGSIVNMGLKNDDGSVCFILGVLKDIQKKLNKGIGDSLEVTFTPID